MGIRMNSLKYNDCRPRIGPIFCLLSEEVLIPWSISYHELICFLYVNRLSLCFLKKDYIFFWRSKIIFLEVKITLLVLKTIVLAVKNIFIVVYILILSKTIFFILVVMLFFLVVVTQVIIFFLVNTCPT